MKNIGSRAEVFHNNALKTTGGLSKNDLFQDKYGNIKSKKKSAVAKKKNNLGRYLNEAGSDIFVLHKKLVFPTKGGNGQVGGGSKKKEIDHIILKSNDEDDVMLIPEQHKCHKEDLHISCKCPLSKKIKHHMCDHIEEEERGFIFPDIDIKGDKDIDFFIIPENGGNLTEKELNSQCKCDIFKDFKIKHKVREHKLDSKEIDNLLEESKSMKGGGKGAAIGKGISVMARGIGKGLAALLKGIAKGVTIAVKGGIKVITVVGKAGGKILVKVVKIFPKIAKVAGRVVTKVIKMTANALKKLLSTGVTIGKGVARGVGKVAKGAVKGVGKVAKGAVGVFKKGARVGSRGLKTAATRGAKVGQKLMTKGASIARRGATRGAKGVKKFGKSMVSDGSDSSSGSAGFQKQQTPQTGMPRRRMPQNQQFDPRQLMSQASQFLPMAKQAGQILQQNPQLLAQAGQILQQTPQLAQQTLQSLGTNPQIIQNLSREEINKLKVLLQPYQP